jgi:hypothetical protein
MSGEAPLADSDRDFHKFCQKSRRLGKNEILRWEKEICFGARRSLSHRAKLRMVRGMDCLFADLAIAADDVLVSC